MSWVGQQNSLNLIYGNENGQRAPGFESTNGQRASIFELSNVGIEPTYPPMALQPPLTYLGHHYPPMFRQNYVDDSVNRTLPRVEGHRPHLHSPRSPPPPPSADSRCSYIVSLALRWTVTGPQTARIAANSERGAPVFRDPPSS